MAAEEPIQDEINIAKRRLGTLLAGRWPLDRLIGIGGMAAVYASRDPADSPVAIKILHSEFSANESVRNRFMREAQLTQAVDHPGRVEVFEEGVSEEGDPYFVMELLEGVTLDKLWKRHGRKLPAEYALEIADRVLEFLGACHEQGIVHRDLKPGNIFITESGFVKVLDFGVARMREAGVDPTLAGTALGTPAYMAPEQALGSGERIDVRTDIFSVGAVLHAMVSGKRLHEGRSHQEAFVLAATRPAPSVARVAPELSPEVVALIDRALSWDPRNRFQTAEEMRAELERVQSGLEPATGENRLSEGRHREAELLTALAEGEDDRPSQPLSVEEHGLLLELREIFTRIERALTAVRQYTWDHKVTQGQFEIVHELIKSFLERHPGELFWEVKPHSFSQNNALLWEPIHPFDEIPYNLFSSGFRSFTLSPGIRIDEVRAFLELLCLDPLRDFAPEDDLATAFWERQLEHLSYKVVTSFLTLNTADEGASDYDELVEQGEKVVAGSGRKSGSDLDAEPMSLEEKAAMIAARQIALRAVRSSASLSLDERARSVIGAALDMPEAEWEARFVNVLGDATTDAVTYGNLSLAGVPLRAALHEHAANRTLEMALRMTVNVAESVTVTGGPEVRAELVQNVLDSETLPVVLKELARPVPERERAAVVRAAPLLGELLRDLGPGPFDTVLAAMARTEVDEVRSALTQYLRKHALGREQTIGELLKEADLPRARVLLGLLGALNNEAAWLALRSAQQNPHAEVRVEAVAMRAAASPEGLRDEIARLIGDSDRAVRAAAFKTMSRYRVKEAGPALVQHITSDRFHKLPVDERKLALETLWELSPARAETLGLELVLKAGMITREAVDDTRIVAIGLLQKFSNRSEVAEALASAAGKWSNSQAVRQAAAHAASAVRARLGVR